LGTRSRKITREGERGETASRIAAKSASIAQPQKTDRLTGLEGMAKKGDIRFKEKVRKDVEKGKERI